MGWRPEIRSLGIDRGFDNALLIDLQIELMITGLKLKTVDGASFGLVFVRDEEVIFAGGESVECVVTLCIGADPSWPGGFSVVDHESGVYERLTIGSERDCPVDRRAAGEDDIHRAGDFFDKMQGVRILYAPGHEVMRGILHVQVSTTRLSQPEVQVPQDYEDDLFAYKKLRGGSGSRLSNFAAKE